MGYIITGVIVFLAICGIVNAIGDDRYANMTDKEFEEEAKRVSGASGVVSALQKIVDPSHRIEYVQEQKERIEADGAESGGPPTPVVPIRSAPDPKN
jgi:hypothetical protein